MAAPEGAATLAGLRNAIYQSIGKRNKRVVLANTNTELKFR